MGTFLCLGTLLVALSSGRVAADEGMWTLDNPPKRLMEERYGFTPDKDWLEHVQLASLRMGSGGSGSFVSPEGLVLTNHHIVVNNLLELSTPGEDFVSNGFFARTREEERPCPGFEIYQLRSYSDVTEAISMAIDERDAGTDAYEAKVAAISRLTETEAEKTGFRCEVVELYQGGEYWIYRYKVYSDVRMVFAPEASAGFYGGDYDNFTYPRYCLDFAFVRVYVDGKPLKTEKWYSWSGEGAAEGELTFVTGHPGKTNRARTLAQLKHERDHFLPFQEERMKQKLAVIATYQARGEEEKRRGHDVRFGTGNYLKRLTGLREGLDTESLFATKAAAEKALRDGVGADAGMREEYGSAWVEIEAVYEKARPRWKRDLFVLSDRYRGGQLATWAETLVRYVQELAKPGDVRLEDFAEAQLPRVRQGLFAEVPSYPDLEEVLLAHYLGELVEHLGTEDPMVRELLQGRSPAETAREAARETRIGEIEFRRDLANLSATDLRESSDPLVKLAWVFDKHFREAHAWQQENLWKVELLAGSRIARAKFALHGKEAYPDATSSLRLSYGKPARYEDGNDIGAFSDGSRGALRTPRWLRGRGAIQPQRAGPRRAVEGGSLHAAEPRDHPRHHGRKLRQPGDQPEPRDRGTDLRQQCPGNCQRLRLFRHGGALGLRPLRRDPGGALENLWNGAPRGGTHPIGAVGRSLGGLEILIIWQERNGTPDEQMGELLQAIFRSARFRPAAWHLHYAWWQRCWGG